MAADIEIECGLNGDEFSAGDLLQASFSIRNTGSAAFVDIFFAFILPDGAVVSIIPGGLAYGTWAYYSDVLLPSNFSYGPAPIFTTVIGSSVPPGEYIYVAAMAPSDKPFNFISVDSVEFSIN